MKVNRSRFFRRIGVLFTYIFCSAASATAAIFTVTNTADSGFGSLRQAIQDANAAFFSANTIEFSNTSGPGVENFYDGTTRTIIIFGNLPNLSGVSTISIVGPGADKLTVQGGAFSDILGVASSTTASLSGLTLSGGRQALATNFGSQVTLNQCAISGNTNTIGFGGAVSNNGTLTINHSTLSGNSAPAGGGAIHNLGTLTINQSTLSGNFSSTGSGGAILNQGTLTVRQSTLAENSAPSNNGGGIFHDNNVGALEIINTVIAGNDAKNGRDIHGQIAVSNGANFIGSAVDVGGLAGSDMTFASTSTVYADVLKRLANNGGPTATHELPESSPIVDRGLNTDAAVFIADQRGYRERIVAGQVDIGAFELGAFPVETGSLVVTGAGDAVHAWDGQVTLREAIIHAATLMGPQTITFSNTATNVSLNFHDGAVRLINLGSQLPSLTGQITLVGPGANKLTVSRLNTPSFSYRVFTVAAGASVSLAGFTISGGQAEYGGGVLVENTGVCKILRCQISGNVADLGGGLANQGTTTIYHSTIANNYCSFSGGGVFNGPMKQLTAAYCTVSGNSCGVNGGGISDDGNQGGNLQVLQCTVSGNFTANGVGGGLWCSQGATLKNSLVAGNSTGGAPPHHDISGTVTSNGANLVGVATGATGLTATDTSFASYGITLAQLIGPLANNGGPTLTHTPLPTGPAVDGGKTTDIPPDTLDVDGDSNTTEPIPQEQRGLVTPFGPRVDLGAVEYSATPYAVPSLVVNSLSDVGSQYDTINTLRDAINYANTLTGPQVITFSSTSASGAVNFYDGAPRFIDLADNLPTLVAQTTITGPGSTKLTLRRPVGTVKDYRILSSGVNATVTITGLAITGGRLSNGAGVSNSGVLTLRDCEIFGNTAVGEHPSGRGAGVLHIVGRPGANLTVDRCWIHDNTARFGGGIWAANNNAGTGQLNVISSTISNNTATEERGGGIFSTIPTVVSSSTINGNVANQGGGINMFDGTLVVNQSTISGNSIAFTGSNNPTYYQGGGIYSEFSPVTLNNCTVTGNTSPNTGGGIDLSGSSSAPLTLNNTIIAGNTSPMGPDVSGTITTSNGANFVGNPAGSMGGSFTDKTFASTGSTLATLLGPLADNGGPTKTHALVAGSPAINAGNNASAVNFFTDQRNYGPRENGGTVDIGAVEAGTLPEDDFSSLVVTGTGDDLNPYDGQRTLREVMNLAGFFPASTLITITFSDGSVPGTTNFHDNTPETIDVSSELPALRANTIVLGPGGNKLTVRRPNTSATFYRIMSVSAGAAATVSGLTIAGGSPDQPGSGSGSFAGGGISNLGNLVISRCTISGNYASGGGGIFSGGGGSLTIRQSTISNNSSSYGHGGGIYFGTGTLLIENSTISGNATENSGGALHINEVAATVTISHSTITGNTNVAGATGTGGIRVRTTIQLNNTIVAGNSGFEISGNVTSNGGNFIGNPAGATGGSLSDKTFQNTSTTLAQVLGPLANNGGPTLTHALVAGSPAINGGINNASFGLFTDQRGYGPRINGTTVDIGSYESGTTAQEVPSLVVTSTAIGTNTFDGQTSLGDALAYAGTLTGPQVITFSSTSAGGAVNFHDATPETIPYEYYSYGAEISISGPGAQKLKIEGSLQVNAGATNPISISGISFIGSSSRAIYNNAGLSLVVSDCAFLGSNSFIYNNTQRQLIVRRCLMSGNAFTPPILNEGTLLVENSTISGNAIPNNAFYNSGAILNDSGAVVINHSTITGNSSSTAAVRNFTGASGSITIKNSIIAGNTSTTGTPDIAGNFTSNGANFIGNPAGSTGATATDKTFANTSTTLAQLLTPLANNGGPTFTHALAMGSPAINTGNSADASGLATDQRGLARIVGTSVDIGAVESAAGASTPLADWRSLHGLAANGSQDLANPSSDGVKNLLKYAFNMAPTAGSLLQPNLTILTPTSTAGLPLITRNASGQLVITFLRRKASTMPGVTCTPETGNALNDFTALSLAGATITSIDATWERVVVIDSIISAKRFGRVRVTPL
jgi:hypothetical protein